MTTIAYRDGILAADTLIAYSNIVLGIKEKITCTGGYLVALAGPAWLRIPLEEWASEGCPVGAVPQALMTHTGEFSALLIDEAGRAFEFDHGYLLEVDSPYIAIGSGGLLAIGAMAHGASAEQAVLAASRHDKNTGGEISTLHFSSIN